MAKIWFCKDGNSPTAAGEANAERPLDEVVMLLKLDKRSYQGNDPTKVRFGAPNDKLFFRGAPHVVVEIEEKESRGSDWEVGFYLSPMHSQEAIKALGL
jgi:hypothetical protein